MTAIFIILLRTVFVVLFIKLVQLLYKRFQFVSIVDKIPGPKAYPVIGNLLTIINVKREDRHEWLRNLSKNHKAGIFRTWIATNANIHLTRAETVGPVLSSKNLITKSEIYKFVNPWVGQGLLTSTGNYWHRHRKLVTPTLHFDILEDFAAVMTEKAEILNQCIASGIKNNPNQTMDVFELLTRCALDIICESAMGININAQTDQNEEYSITLHSITSQAMERLFRPWHYADWIYYRTRYGKEFKKTVENAHSFTYKVIRERKLAREMQRQNSIDNSNNDGQKRPAFLDHLLNACERENMPFNDDELREEVDTFLVAGHDTTSAAMSWALFCIGNNPDVQEKIREEQLRVFGESKEAVTFQQLSELEYLDRVIKETLRLFPSAPIIGRHITEDVEIAGYKVPKGSFVKIHISEVHRDSKYWPEPEKFDPDRFLPKNLNGRHPYSYVPFSAGPRNCIGQKFANVEQKIVLTAILRTWRVKSLVKFEEIKCYSEMILRPQNGIHIFFTPVLK